jgi:hypothetical protein
MVRAVRQNQPDRGAIVMPLTVDQYDRMIETGILPEGEPYELLDGLIVRKNRSATGENPMTIGSEHVWVIQQLMTLFPKVKRLGARLWLQLPISLPPHSEPEPDGAIVMGPEDQFKHRRPTAADVPCVIEIADSSLRYDRTTKLRIYANGGIEQYVIVNLPDRVIELHTGPVKGKGRYARLQILRTRQTLKIIVGEKNLSVPVRLLLP